MSHHQLLFTSLKFKQYTIEVLRWLDANFDYYQETFHRKWDELAKAMVVAFRIEQFTVSGEDVRCKLLSYWVCFANIIQFINLSIY